MKVNGDRSVCIGAGMCVLRAPEVFDQDDAGTVVVLHAEPGEEQDEAVLDAVDLCPSGAITISAD